MPPKGVTTRLNPVRLQTIPHLRVRRPNQHEQNPCVTVMSSMLSMSTAIYIVIGLCKPGLQGVWWSSFRTSRHDEGDRDKFPK
jgi:hypothetical protein